MSPAPTTAVICLGGATAPANDDGGTLSISVKSKSDLATAVSGTSSNLSSITIRVSATELSGLYDPMALASLVSSLAPGGAVQVEILGGNNGGSGVDLMPVNDSFVLAGLGAESERRDGTSRILTARKKKATDLEPASNKSAPIKLNLGGGGSSAVKINLNDGDDDDDMVDEDDLLAEEGAGGVLAPPPAVDAAARAAAADDCGGRKACDNCSCGRAELEAMERAAGGGAAAAADENQPKQVPSSSCGNCSKGDAFRCAGCPYLGKPAFKPGEEHLVLDLADDL
mmetsp:Transcript_8015/g.22362  ORF Transcript_8015/g.22362 Transcript_8015/m.22362 type:complete len:284 (+) Transcript_8015:344-1195(+)